MKTNCKFCGTEFEFQAIAGLPFELKPTVCDPCHEKRQQDEAAAKEARAIEKWKRLCPSLYQDTDPNHPSMPGPAKLSRILNWKVGPTGMVIVGPTRSCKTRCVWLLIKRLLKEGVNVIPLTAMEFAHQSAEFAGAGAEIHSDWMRAVSTAAVLFVDDLGKFKLTERVEADLFEVIENRTSNKLPIIFTSNFTGSELMARMSEDRGGPIVYRIRDFCESITLKPNKP